MRKIYILCYLCIMIVGQLSAQEYYFKFKVKDKSEINKVSNIISIDNYQDNYAFAYANKAELKRFTSLGYTPILLEKPCANNIKTMATTVAEMASWDRYPTYEVYEEMMNKFVTDYPDICQLENIGSTVQGRDLYVMKISDNVATDEGEPEFFYTSTMHGDETVGYVLMLRLIDYLCTNYTTDPRVQNMVNNIEIYINPNANPDGTYIGGNSSVSSSQRYNANSVDLNRNFPGPFTPGNIEPEIDAMLNFADNRNLVMSANLHGGVELVNFPWDFCLSSVNLHPDNDWFFEVSTNYAVEAQTASPAGYFMGQGNGVTQGGNWYVVDGSRQDYMNYYHACREITIELSNTKNPNSNELPDFWDYNIASLLDYIEECTYGITGTVTNINGEPLAAEVFIINEDKDGSMVTTEPVEGKYYRINEPGTYQIRYSSYGYISQEHTVTVNDYKTVTVQDVVLGEAQQTILSGTVTDLVTGAPVENVEISIIDHPEFSTTTNASGEYNIPNIYENTYQVKCYKQGYKTKTESIELSTSNNELDFALEISTAISFEDQIISSNLTGNSYPWEITNNKAYDGNYSIKSTIEGNNDSESIIELNAQFEAGEISFWYSVSSESNYDKFKFYIDNNEMLNISGIKDWTEFTGTITAGIHILKWEYSKDMSASAGDDCAYLDYIDLPAYSNIAATIETIAASNISENSATLNATFNPNNNNITNIHFEYGVDTNYGNTINSNPNSISGGTNIINVNADISNLVPETIYHFRIIAESNNDTIYGEDINFTTLISSIKDVKNNIVKIYPNPNNGEFIIHIDSNKSFDVEIYNINGLKIAEFDGIKNNNKIKLNKLNSGLYILRIGIDEEFIFEKFRIK